MAIKKRIWIPSSIIILLGIVVAAAWWYVPEYAEKRFTEKLVQVGIETDSIEFRIEGLSRPVIRDLSLRISGVNLVAKSIEFGSLWDGYGEDKPLKIKVNGLWAGVNAQIPEGLLKVNKAILALPKEETFRVPLPMEISFEDGVVLYENHDRQIEGVVDGDLFVEGSLVNWELDIDVRKHPIRGRGSFDWSSGLIDITGEMDLSHHLSLAIWDILNEEPLFDWNAGQLQTAFHFEGDNYRYDSGQVHAVLNDVGVDFKGLQVSHSSHVASIIWTPGHTTLDFTGDGILSELIESPFDWRGSLSVEPGPNLQFQLSDTSIAPQWDFGSFHLSQGGGNETPLEVSLLGDGGGFDFQILGLDLLLGSELGDQLASSNLDLMLNGRWEDSALVSTTADLWMRDGMLISPMFQAEVGEALLNVKTSQPYATGELIPAIVANPGAFFLGANLSDATLFRFSDVVGEAITLNWSPGSEASITAEGEFYGIGNLEMEVMPDEKSTLRSSSGVVMVNPGEFTMDYELDLDPASGLKAELNLEDYPIESYPHIGRWVTGEFDITGTLDAEALFEVTPEEVNPRFDFSLSNVLYASGDLVLDNANYTGVIDSLMPFHLKSKQPFTVSTLQIRGWTAADLQTDFEIGNRINITDTSLSAFGGSLEFSDISMGLNDLFIESEIGVNEIQTEQILEWIPKVIGMAEGSISGVIPFQWDIKESQFSLGRGHLQSPEGELGFMNLKIFRPERDKTEMDFDDRYSMVDEALSNLQDSSLDIDILPPNELTDDTRVRLNIKGFVDSRLVKAPVDVVRYYSLPIESLTLTMEQVRQDLPGIRSSID